MDAHIAVTIASYLSLHQSNIFLSILDLTEHVVALTDILATNHPRCLEMVRCLGYPTDLIIRTDNYQAAIECIDRRFILNINLLDFLKDFDRLGNYTRTYPRGIAKVIDSSLMKFLWYIMTVKIDMRYVDFLRGSDIIAAHLSHPQFPKWSLNQHLVDPSIDNLVNIAKKIRLAENKYSSFIYDGGVFITYSTTNTGHFINYHYWIFVNNVHRFVDSPENIRRLIDASFTNDDVCRQWLTNNQHISNELRQAIEHALM